MRRWANVRTGSGWLCIGVALALALAVGCGEPPPATGTAEKSRAPALALYTPKAWPELTTEALRAARAKLPKDAPEDAMIDGKITPGKRGGKLVYGYASEIKSFNPVFTDSASDDEAQALMYAGLIGYDRYEQKDMPGLAKTWSYDEATRTWTFNLRKGIKWSDGQPLTSDDFIFFTQVIFDPKIPNQLHFYLRQEPKENSPPYVFSAPDAWTLKVQIPSVDSFSYVNVRGLMPLPRHALENAWKSGKFLETWLQNVNPRDLVVSGPYKLKTLRQGESMIFERNPYYWVYDGEGGQLPYLDEIVMEYVSDQQAEHVKFLAGELDMMEENIGIFPEMLPKFIDSAKQGNFTVYALGPSLNIDHYFFNLNRGGTHTDSNGKKATWNPSRPDEKPGPELKNFKPFVDPIKLNWFTNVEFRRACSEATDRQRMIDTVLFGQGQPLYGAESAANKVWFNPEASKYRYDPAAAKARLDKLGWVDHDGDGIREDSQGHPIRFTIATNKDNNIRLKVQQLLVENLRAVGLGAEQQVLEFNNLVTRLRDTYDFDAAMLGLATSVPPHPAGGANVWPSTGENHLGYPKQKAPMSDWEAQIDNLFAQMKQTFNVDEQKRIFFEMQRIFNEEQPAIGLFTRNGFAAARNRVGNLKPTIMRVSVTHNIDELYIK